MAKRRFTSPIGGIVSAPKSMDTFGQMTKRSDGWYFPQVLKAGQSPGNRPVQGKTPEGNTVVLIKGASNEFRLTDAGTAWVIRGQFTDLTETMICIAFAESDGDAVIIGGPNGNGTYDYGLFQNNSSHAGNMAQLTAWWDPRANTAMARQLYTESRTRLGNVEDALREQWSSYKSGTAQMQLLRARAALAVAGGALDAGAVEEKPLLGIIEDITDPDNPDGIAGAIDDGIGGLLKSMAPVAYIAGGAIVLLLGVVMIMKAQGKKQ